MGPNDRWATALDGGEPVLHHSRICMDAFTRKHFDKEGPRMDVYTLAYTTLNASGVRAAVMSPFPGGGVMVALRDGGTHLHLFLPTVDSGGMVQCSTGNADLRVSETSMRVHCPKGGEAHKRPPPNHLLLLSLLSSSSSDSLVDGAGDVELEEGVCDRKALSLLGRLVSILPTHSDLDKLPSQPHVVYFPLSETPKKTPVRSPPRSRKPEGEDDSVHGHAALFAHYGTYNVFFTPTKLFLLDVMPRSSSAGTHRPISRGKEDYAGTAYDPVMHASGAASSMLTMHGLLDAVRLIRLDGAHDIKRRAACIVSASACLAYKKLSDGEGPDAPPSSARHLDGASLIGMRAASPLLAKGAPFPLLLDESLLRTQLKLDRPYAKQLELFGGWLLRRIGSAFRDRSNDAFLALCECVHDVVEAPPNAMDAPLLDLASRGTVLSALGGALHPPSSPCGTRGCDACVLSLQASDCDSLRWCRGCNARTFCNSCMQSGSKTDTGPRCELCDLHDESTRLRHESTRLRDDLQKEKEKRANAFADAILRDEEESKAKAKSTDAEAKAAKAEAKAAKAEAKAAKAKAQRYEKEAASNAEAEEARVAKMEAEVRRTRKAEATARSAEARADEAEARAAEAEARAVEAEAKATEAGARAEEAEARAEEAEARAEEAEARAAEAEARTAEAEAGVEEAEERAEAAEARAKERAEEAGQAKAWEEKNEEEKRGQATALRGAREEMLADVVRQLQERLLRPSPYRPLLDGLRHAFFMHARRDLTSSPEWWQGLVGSGYALRAAAEEGSPLRVAVGLPMWGKLDRECARAVEEAVEEEVRAHGGGEFRVEEGGRGKVVVRMAPPSDVQ